MEEDRAHTLEEFGKSSFLLHLEMDSKKQM